MAGQKTTIVVNDYNEIQTKIANILGVGDADYGYGQLVTSSQLTTKTLISNNVWTNLRNDMLRARQHQTGVDESGNLLPVVKGTHITESQRAAYNTYANTIVSNRLITPPATQATRSGLVSATRITAWNSTITHSVTVTFTDVNSARYYFNSGSTIEFSATRTGGNTGLKNTSWTTLLTNMGTISFKRSGTTTTGSGTAAGSIGYSNLTTSDQLIFQKLTETLTYSPNQYDVYAKIGSSSAQIIFTITFSDLSGGNLDENVDGTLTSIIQTYRASGSNVSVVAPSATSSITGGDVVVTPPSPAPVPTYTISADTGQIAEGIPQLGWFTVTTTNVPTNTTLYWTTTGSGITASDFTDNTLSGTVVITYNNGVYSGLFRRLASADNTTEGQESFKIQLRTGSITGSIVAETDNISINDLSLSPVTTSYTVTQDYTIMSEGNTGINYTINTTNVVNGTVLYWTTIANTGIDSSDFTDNTLSGTVTINNNTGVVTRTAKADYITEGSESFQIQFRTGSITGPVVATSSSGGTLILDTSLNPSYTITSSPSSVDETTNTTFSITLTTASVPSGSTRYFTFGGTATYGTDYTYLSGPALSVTSGSSGSFVTSGSSMTWVFQVVTDHLTEGSETVFFQLRETSISSTVVAQSPTVIIGDTSLSASYAITLNKTSINETTSKAFTITLTTTNMIPGTIVYPVAHVSNNMQGGCVITSGPTSTFDTSITINSAVMTWNCEAATDNITEGLQTLYWTIHSGSSSGPILATSPTLTIQDTSLTPPSGSISISPSPTVDEGSTFTITFTNSNFALGTILYANGIFVSGTNSGDMSIISGQAIGTDGSFPITGPTMIWTISVIADLLTEGSESVKWEIHTDSITGPLLCTSNTITINDTSLTGHGTTTFNSSGSFTIPPGITTVNVIALGGGGGAGGDDSHIGTNGIGGSIVNGNITVSSGQVLSLVVGQGGGLGESGKSNGNGGTAGSGYSTGGIGGRSGASGTSGCGGGGGGSSAVLIGSTVKLVAAGGGGGAGGGNNSAGHTSWDYYLATYPQWYSNRATGSNGAPGWQTGNGYDGGAGGAGGGGYPMGGDAGSPGGYDNGGTVGQSGQSYGGTVTGTGTNYGLNASKTAGTGGYITITW